MAKRLLGIILAQHTAAPPQLKTRVLACFVGRAVATFRGIRDAETDGAPLKTPTRLRMAKSAILGIRNPETLGP